MSNLEKIEKIIHSVPFGDRSGAVIELVYLTEQWFLDVKGFSKRCCCKSKKERNRVFPKSWTISIFILG